MTYYTLHGRLAAIARRAQWARGLGWVAGGWCVVLCAGWLLTTGSQGLSGQGLALGLAVATAAVLATVLACRPWLRPTSQQIVKQVERLEPSVNARLITAIEQAPDLQTGRFHVLQHQVLNEAVSYFGPEWKQRLVPAWRLTLPALLAVLEFGAISGLAWRAISTSDHQSRLPLQASGMPGIIPADLPVTIEPGDTEIERGSSLLVMARFRDELPDRVLLHLTSSDGATEEKPLDKALDDPIFGTRLANVQRDFTYTVQYDDATSREYRVAVYDLPALIRSDLVIQAPGYTGQPEKRLENAFAATLVEGSSITIECRVNKPLTTVVLTDPQGQVTELSRASENPLLWTCRLTPITSQRLTLHMKDERGRENRDPDQFRIEVVPNQPPKLELAFPGKDVRVSPLEEFTLEGRISDDYGLDDFGVVLTVAGREPQTISLGKDVQGNAPQAIRWMQALEELQVAPDDLISYHLYAIDRGPDGQPRKVIGDLFFAEVRPFEETFRQMDAPPGGSSQAGPAQQQEGNQFENLIQVQKQIVAATWNQIRQAAPEWTPAADEQLAVISESQATNKTKLLELMLHIQGAAKQRVANLAVDQMSAAEEELTQAAEKESRDPLAVAVAAEQSAYQALLKLRARDHNVMQGQQGGGGSGSSASPSEQQLQELELSERQNRYESRSAAQAEGAASAQREELGILDRLKELARRQGDLNQKLRELDAALRLAETAAQQAEIERQLKRLRDEQQQLLQDADELRNRLAQSSRQEEFRETREELENTRRRMVDATEALRENQLSQALSSSSRAERELDNLQQEFRQQTSARFADEMRDLREVARDVAQREERLSQELSGSNPEAERPSLRQDRTRADLQDEFEQQRAAVAELLNRAKEIVQASETAEPLLSQQLYDTLRNTRDDQLEPALEAVPQLLQRGFVPEAQKVEEQVQKGLERLQAGVEQAAESVLGSEVESLKRARREIAELSQSLQQELQQQQAASGQPGSPNGAEGTTRAPNGEGMPSGQSPDGQPGNTPSENGQPGQPAANGQGTGQPGAQPGQPSGSGQPSESGQPGQTNSPGQPGQQGAGNSPGQPSPMGQGQSGQGQGGQGQGEQPGQGQGQGNQPGQGSGQPGGQAPGGQAPGGQAADGQATGGLGQGGLRRGSPGGQPSPGNPLGGADQGGLGGGSGGQGGPISGDGYRDFTERLRDVETMLADPDLQAEVSKLREQARSLRAEFKRHSESPNWDLVKTDLYEPMIELQRRLAEEVAQRESNEALVPIDRDPVPSRYRELVRSYYERLGRGAD